MPVIGGITHGYGITLNDCFFQVDASIGEALMYGGGFFRPFVYCYIGKWWKVRDYIRSIYFIQDTPVGFFNIAFVYPLPLSCYLSPRLTYDPLLSNEDGFINLNYVTYVFSKCVTNVSGLYPR
jgi:hypothetical protein